MLVGKSGEDGQRRWWLTWLFPVVGLVSLIWFLVRVVPKPARAAYPCQRVAGSLAGGFMVWIAGMVGSVFAYRRGKQLFLHSRLGKAALCFAIAGVVGIIAIERMPEKISWADPGVPENAPIGVGRGVQPGRVVWVHDPNVTSWTFPGSDSYANWDGETDMGVYGYWYERTDQTVMDQMVSDAIKGLAGESTEADAWDAIFRHYNIEQGKGNVGYQAGEKFMIKINLTTAARIEGTVNGSGDQTTHKGWINTSPQIILAVLDHLVNVVGVSQSDITVGDTTAYLPNHYYNRLVAVFPNVRYLDCNGVLSGRTGAQTSQGTADETRMYWSTSEASGATLDDYVPLSYVQAEYLINLAVLKGHYCGITVCAKNHFGSLIRTPNPAYGGFGGYYNMHWGMPGDENGFSPGMNRYRTVVDITGHAELGAKTVLYLVDGLYGGYMYQGQPYRWNMAPFGGEWPCTILASMDPVAIDSVAYDFLLTEWPHIVAASYLEGGAEDYLHEAALAHNPGSGTVYDPDGLGQLSESLGVHEHWNNATDKQYSRDLGIGIGIELYIPGVSSDSSGPIPGDINGDGVVDEDDLVAFGLDWLRCTDPTVVGCEDVSAGTP